MKKVLIICCCLCLVVIVGLVLYKSDDKDDSFTVTIEDSNMEVKESKKPVEPTEPEVITEEGKFATNTNEMEDEYEKSTVSSIYTYVSSNYKLDTSDATSDEYMWVRNMTLSEAEFCVPEAFDEFLTAIEFDSGERVRFMDCGDGVYIAEYENCSLSYSYRANRMTVIKSPVQYS